MRPPTHSQTIQLPGLASLTNISSQELHNYSTSHSLALHSPAGLGRGGGVLGEVFHCSYIMFYYSECFA